MERILKYLHFAFSLRSTYKLSSLSSLFFFFCAPHPPSIRETAKEKQMKLLAIKDLLNVRAVCVCHCKLALYSIRQRARQPNTEIPSIMVFIIRQTVCVAWNGVYKQAISDIVPHCNPQKVSQMCNINSLPSQYIDCRRLALWLNNTLTKATFSCFFVFNVFIFNAST